jgi:hypothetical protein
MSHYYFELNTSTLWVHSQHHQETLVLLPSKKKHKAHFRPAAYIGKTGLCRGLVRYRPTLSLFLPVITFCFPLAHSSDYPSCPRWKHRSVGGTVKKDNNWPETTEGTQDDFKTCARAASRVNHQLFLTYTRTWIPIHSMRCDRRRTNVLFSIGTFLYELLWPILWLRTFPKLTFAQFPSLCRRTRPWSLSFVRWMQFTSSRPISQRATLTSFRLHVKSLKILSLRFAN